MGQDVKVLVADGNDEHRHALCDNLTHAGLSVVYDTATGINLKAKIKTFMPDVVLMDAWLPHCEVLYVAKELKESGEMMSMPFFIVVTYGSDPSYFMEAADLGISYCVPRPLDIPVLIEKIFRLAVTLDVLRNRKRV